MEAKTIQTKPVMIKWAQIWSLAALNAAIVISWIAYHNYQPKLLEKFELTKLSFFLVFAQAIILTFIPPIAGRIGDYMINKNSNYFVIITVGISITAMVFMAVAFTISGNPFSGIAFVLPVLIIIWLIAMNIFHSPANSMIELFAPARNLPIAMGIIVITTDILYGFEPIVIDLVDFLGPTFTFITGAFLIIVSGTVFIKSVKKIELKRSFEEANTDQLKSNFFLVGAAGFSLGFIISIIQNILPDTLLVIFGEYSSPVFGTNHHITFIFILSAIAAYPISLRIGKTALWKVLLASLCFVSISLCLVLSKIGQGETFLSLVILSISFSLVSVTAFPFALGKISAKHVTFGTGIFFGALELANGIIEIALALWDML